jgi:hypothetical protein
VAVLVAVCGLGAGCAENEYNLVEPMDVSDSVDVPTIRRILDLGTALLDVKKPLDPGAGDGVASIGEALLIEGDGFGRQPTVSVGGVPTDVIGRTDPGGIVVRVPPRAPAGLEPVEVRNTDGVATAQFPVRRLAVVVQAATGSIETVSVAPGGQSPVQDVGRPLSVSGALFVAVPPAGGAAYVFARQPKETGLTVIDLGAKQAPTIVTAFDLPIDAPVAATSAVSRPLSAVVGARAFLLLDTTDVQHPSRYETFDLPAGGEAIERGALSPDGTLLALAGRNSVSIYDVSIDANPNFAASAAPAQLKQATSGAALRDIAWKSDSSVLYVVSGADAESEKSGPRQAVILPIGVARSSAGGLSLTYDKAIKLPEGVSPVALATIHGSPLGAGTTIALPPDKPIAYAQVVDESLVEATSYDLASADGQGQAASLLANAKPETDGVLAITASGQSTALPGEIEIGGGLAVTPDDAMVLALECRREGADRLFAALTASLYALPANQTFSPPPVPLGSLTPDHLGPPCAIGDVAVEP